MNPRYAFYRLGGPQSRRGLYGEVKMLGIATFLGFVYCPEL
jgi:hypothetical protein